jgi:hypothetical protein
MNNSAKTRDIARGIYLWACVQDLPLSAQNTDCIEWKAWRDWERQHSRSTVAVVQKEQYDLFDRVLNGYTIEWSDTKAGEIVRVHSKTIQEQRELMKQGNPLHVIRDVMK